MNSSYRLTPFSLLEKFNFILERLAEDERNINIEEAIISWCKELSLEKYFPQISKEIIDYTNLWLQENTVLENTLKLYRKLLVITDIKNTKFGIGNWGGRLAKITNEDFYDSIQETKKEMNAKSIIFVAFILTGIGLLLFLLNKKGGNSKTPSNVRSSSQFNYVTPIKEKYILALLIKSDRYQELIHSIKNNNFLQIEDSSKLYGATQGLWIGAESKFEKSKIKQELINCNPVSTTSEYDVHFVTIELDSKDPRFYPDVNPMDRRDAFIELGNKSPQITVVH